MEEAYCRGMSVARASKHCKSWKADACKSPEKRAYLAAVMSERGEWWKGVITRSAIAISGVKPFFRTAIRQTEDSQRTYYTHGSVAFGFSSLFPVALREPQRTIPESLWLQIESNIAPNNAYPIISERWATWCPANPIVYPFRNVNTLPLPF